MSCPAVIKVVTPGPPGPALQLTGPSLAGRVSGTGGLQSIGLGSGLSIVDGALTITAAPGSDTLTSVGLSAPTGFSVAGSPITSSGTLELSFAAGYSLPSDSTQAGWTAGAALAATAIQPGNPALTDAREWTAATISQAEAEAGTATTRRAFTAERVFQAVAAWWAASSAKTKLDGIASGATANLTDAELRDRSTHTGTQSASTITGLSSVATSGAYGDLSGRPTLGTAAAANIGDFATAAEGSLAATAVQPGALAAVATSGAYSDLSGTPGLVTSSTAGLVPATGGGTTNFLRADGTFAAPPGGTPGGSSGQLQFNNDGAFGGVSTSSIDGSGNLTFSAQWIQSVNGAASSPSLALTGTWFTGGTATTTKPHVLIEPSGATSAAWSTSGTGLGVNAASGFAGNLLDLQVNGTSYLSMSTSYLQVNGVIGSVRIDGSVKVRADRSFQWAASNNIDVASDILLLRDAAGTLAQRNGTNAQVTRIYDTFTSATDYHRIAIATARATLSNVSGASVTATGLIPAGAVVMGVTSKVTTALGTTNGTTGYKIGTATDDDRWGGITGTALGTTSDNRNWTSGTIECFPAATDVIVTATGGNFDATGVIYLSVQYMTGQAD